MRIGGRKCLVLPVWTVVTVVLVFVNPDASDAYEVEAYIPEEDEFALATIEARDSKR